MSEKSKKAEKKEEAVTPASLEKDLSFVLKKCVIEKGFVQTKPDDVWGWDFAEKVEKLKGKYIDVAAAWRALIDLVKSKFAEIEYSKRPSGVLVDIVTDQEFEDLKSEILEYFLSIPRSYSFYFKITCKNEHKIKSIKFSESSEIINVTKSGPYTKINPGWELNGLLTQILMKTKGKSQGVFFPGDTLLKIDCSGYVDLQESENLAAGVAISKLKNILYFGKTLLVFDHSNKRVSPWGGIMKSDFYVVDNTTGKNVAAKINLSDDLGSYLFGFEIAPLIKFKKKKKMDFRIESLKQIGAFIDQNGSDANKVPITTSLQWAFESAASVNQTVAFIQLCIGLEAILGDDQTKEHITSTLADRCAYSLRGSFEDRKQARERFKKLYDFRSKLVHGRRLKIDQLAFDSFRWGTYVLEKVLLNELRNFKPTKATKDSIVKKSTSSKV